MFNAGKAIYGDPPWERCECGKWRSRKTGEHVEMETLSLKQFMERYGRKCPDAKERK